MVYLQFIFNRRRVSFIVISLILLINIVEVQNTKIAYKKSINGKTNIKEKRLKPIKPTTTTTTSTTTTTTTTMAPSTLPISEKDHPEDSLEIAETTHSHKVSISGENGSVEVPQPGSNEEATTKPAEASIEQSDIVTDIAPSANEEIVPNEIDKVTEINSSKENDKTKELHSREISQEVLESPPNSLESTRTSTETITPITTEPNKRPVPCTCGVFMGSQIKRTGNPYDPPLGKPVIINELDRLFPCTAVGQKQCQTKCLETIVQHLPNSANILCASLDHDIRKERAYLFIKNCRNQWYNTKLAAGREYCCKNGLPYQCPMV